MTRRLHELDASLAATRLAQGVGVLVSFLAAEQEGVRFAAAQALQAVLRTCLDAKVCLLCNSMCRSGFVVMIPRLCAQAHVDCAACRA